MCRITINAQGVEITDSVRRLIEDDLGAVLEPHGVRVASAHVRLWEGVDIDGATTCFIRVDLSPSGGLGLGATAADIAKAVRTATERVGMAVKNELAYPTTPPASWWFRGGGVDVDWPLGPRGRGVSGCYGDQAPQLAAIVAVSLVENVLWGTVSGAMLPFALRSA